MKFDPNCVREILLTLEDQPYGTCLSIPALASSIKEFQEDEISYCCLKLAEADCIDITTVNMTGSLVPGIKSVNDITFSGHEFLNNIRDDNNWNKIKGISSSIGFASLKVVSAIAEGVATAAINQQLGFSK